ncbi:MAG: ATP-binding protein [Alphaproteobacteria bacterium]
MTTPPAPLDAAALRRRCDPRRFGFETTAELPEIDQVPGQERAVEAVRFGIGMRSEGYNIYALGPNGTGKHRLILEFLNRQAATERTPDDWCYVNNPDMPHKPRTLRLPAGRGAPLKADMEHLVEDARVALPRLFESNDYRTRRQAVDEEFKEWHERIFGGIQRDAEEHAIALVRTPVGMALAPTREGEVLSPDDFRKLPAAEQESFKANMASLQERLQKALEEIPQWEKKQREKVRQLNRDMTRYAVSHLIQDLRKKYADLPAVVAYLDTVEGDIVENAQQFISPEQPQPETGGGMTPVTAKAAGNPAFNRFQVNLLVDNGGCKGAPVIHEDHPAYPNLVGRVEHIAQFGALVTDFTLIKAGALHRANGGYLILDARRVLMQPFAFEELKRVLRSREIKIESLSQALSIVSTVSLEPEPIPLNVKIVLVGDRMIYYLLSAYDPEFDELFKVAVDFDDQTSYTDENIDLFARLIGTIARRENLKPFDRTAVARIVEQASRAAQDTEKITTHIRSIADLVREANHWSQDKGAKAVTAADVDHAIAAQIRRADRVRERVHENIVRGTVMIDTAGATVGQINGLSVLSLGGFSFGQPSRITARVRLGRGEVIDIERRAELGGPLHSKGVMILSGYLGSHFAAERPLSLSASLVFEQSYGGVDGDSASLAELCALISALAEIPIRQSFAMTGSVNQHGQVQPIGGVNEKIEGFFDVCARKGLTGEQGVIIPSTNIRHLMLRPDVVEACAAGRFRVHAVSTVNEALALLTGLPAGERDAAGTFPDGSVNRRAEARLIAFGEKARAFGRPPPNGSGETGSGKSDSAGQSG